MATYESKKYKFTGAQLTDLAAPNMADGTVSDEEFQRLDGVTSDIQTQIDAGLGSGGGTMTGDLAFGDNVLAKFGASNDLQIFHDGNNSIVKDVGTGDLVLGGDNVQITNAALSETKLYLHLTELLLYITQQRQTCYGVWGSEHNRDGYSHNI